MASWFLYPLGILAVLGMLFFIERLFYLYRVRIATEPFVKGVENLCQQSDMRQALMVCENTPGAIARLTQVAVLNLQAPLEGLRAALQKGALLELPLLRKRIESLRVMGQLAPLIGLIGTIFFLLKGFWTVGTMQAYTQLTSFSPYLLSALSVTFLGLLELLLFNLAYAYLAGRVRLLIFDLEWTASEWVLFAQMHAAKKDAGELVGQNVP
jgi:biopolymer transport protein ExbB